MAGLLLQEIYDKSRDKYELSLHAGAEGLGRTLRWLYFSEDIENQDFLRGGELVIITGFAMKSGAELLWFVKSLREKQCCGLIVNVGKYLHVEDFTRELLDYCEAESFPLITMPWQYHLSDIIRDYSREILMHTREVEGLRGLIQLLLRGERLSSEEEVELALGGYQRQGVYGVAVFFCPEGAPEVHHAEALRILAETHLDAMGRKGLMFLQDGVYTLLLQGEALEDTVTACLALPGFGAMRAGLGSLVSNLHDIAESERRAQFAASFTKARRSRALRFDALGVQQLLYSCRDKSILPQFCSVLQLLREHDGGQDGGLAETLRLYLRYHGSVQLVSKAMFCHRNTTNYRLKKIRSILGIDLDDREQIFALQLAFAVEEYLLIRKRDETDSAP